MSNKHASKQHGLKGNIRPKSKPRKRRNKELARKRREERQAAKLNATAKPSTPKKETVEKAE